jgi:hypothetical protein
MMNYGEAFLRMGVKNMGRQGAPWCGLNADGVMVLMGHQNYFKKTGDGGWAYLDPGAPNEIAHSGSARTSLNMLSDYFVPGKKIFVIIGEFFSDGASDSNGVVEAARFKSAAGGYYEAEMRAFDRDNGVILCQCIQRKEM